MPTSGCSWVTENSRKGRSVKRVDSPRSIIVSNMTAIVDYNGLQISGAIDCVMPQNIVENYLADGWDILEINGHDYGEIFGHEESKGG